MTATQAPAAQAEQRYYAGIDPSLTGTGICILIPGEKPFVQTISTSPKTHPNIYNRLNHIVSEIKRMLIDEFGLYEDDVICIERPFVSPQNMNAQQNLLVLSHKIRECLYNLKMPWRDVSPMSLKKFVCGTGKAEKSMMLMRVYKNWDISADDDNQADAVGLAQMARAMDSIRRNTPTDSLTKNQIEIARKVLAGN